MRADVYMRSCRKGGGEQRSLTQVVRTLDDLCEQLMKEEARRTRQRETADALVRGGRGSLSGVI